MGNGKFEWVPVFNTKGSASWLLWLFQVGQNGPLSLNDYLCFGGEYARSELSFRSFTQSCCLTFYYTPCPSCCNRLLQRPRDPGGLRGSASGWPWLWLTTWHVDLFGIWGFFTKSDSVGVCKTFNMALSMYYRAGFNPCITVKASIHALTAHLRHQSWRTVSVSIHGIPCSIFKALRGSSGKNPCSEVQWQLWHFGAQVR